MDRSKSVINNAMIPFKLCPGGDCPKRHTCQRYLEYAKLEASGSNAPCQVLPEPQWRPEKGTCEYEMPKEYTSTAGDKVEYPMPEALTSEE